MFAGALRDAIIADPVIAGLLGKYRFDPNGAPTPSVFTSDPIPLDDGSPNDPLLNDTLPAIVITETLGEGLGGERDKSAADAGADIKIVGRRDHAHEQYRRIAWKVWNLLDKNSEVKDSENEFNILGVLAEPPQDLGVDPEGFPQILISVSATVYTEAKGV